MVAGSIARLNVAARLLPVATPVAPLTGRVEITVGGDGGVTVGGMVALLPPPVSMVTAPPEASALPESVEPVAIEIDTAARMFP